MPRLADRRAFVAAGLMLGAAVFANVRRPSSRAADGAAPPLAAVIPERFGAWRIDTAVPVVLPSPDLQAVVERTYAQVVSRTYANAAGNRIMFLLAYSVDQTEAATQAHSPEVCYPAQGFTVVRRAEETVAAGDLRVPAVRMLTRAPGRVEPVTFWFTIGDTVPRNSLQLRLASMRHTLTGQIADGLLVRVSSIDTDERHAYAMHDAFLNDLLTVLEPTLARRVFGTGTSLA